MMEEELMNQRIMVAKLFVVIMGVIGLITIILAWVTSESSKGYIKDDANSDSKEVMNNQKSFDRTMTILIVLGVMLMTISVALFLFGRSCGGFEKMAQRDGYYIYMISCAVIALMILILSSIAYSLVDFEKRLDEDGELCATISDDCKSAGGARGSLIAMIVMSSVALGVGGFYVIATPFKQKLMSENVGASMGGDEKGDAAAFGFDFDF